VTERIFRAPRFVEDVVREVSRGSAAPAQRAQITIRGTLDVFDNPVWPTLMLGNGPPVWGPSMFTSAGSATGALA